MNEAAAEGLALLSGWDAVAPPGGLAPGLQEIADKGVELRGEVVVWTGGAKWAPQPPGGFPDLTGWECFVNSFHLEDEVPVRKTTSPDGQPSVSEQDQLTLLRHGVTLGLLVCRAAAALARPVPVRCVVAVNDTNGTFRFHRIRPGEDWVLPDLDSYRREKVVVIDVEPPRDAPTGG